MKSFQTRTLWKYDNSNDRKQIATLFMFININTSSKRNREYFGTYN